MDSPRQKALELLTQIVTSGKYDMDRQMQAAEVILKHTSTNLPERVSLPDIADRETQGTPVN
jgi:hypothetical protein